MFNIFQLLPYLLLFSWLVFSIYYLIKPNNKNGNGNPYYYESIPQVFPTIGILGTFIGIAYGLYSFNVHNIESSIPALLDGLKSAFYASIIGIICSILFSKIIENKKWNEEKEKLSTETTAINNLIELVSELRKDFKDNFIYIDEFNNEIKPANIIRDIYNESEKQTKALKSFTTDLAININASFEANLSNQVQNGLIPELLKIGKEIENLGNKLNDPTTEMTKNVVQDLKLAITSMVEELKSSMSGSTKSELENLTTLLSQAGGSLNDFPAKLLNMTENLNENFRGLQDIVQQISKQTLSQSEHSTDQMRKQVEEMSEILKLKVGDLQLGQEVLITKQSENLQISDKLLNAFNTSIEKMNGLSVEVSQTISKFSEIKGELITTSSQLRNSAENVNLSSSKFQEGQLKFANHSNDFLNNNNIVIDEIQKSLSIAREVSVEYADRFFIIEKGLESIFSQIQGGLASYKDTVGESLQSYLGKYSEALTITAESLAAASSKQEDLLEEWTEQLSKYNNTKAY